MNLSASDILSNSLITADTQYLKGKSTFQLVLTGVSESTFQSKVEKIIGDWGDGTTFIETLDLFKDRSTTSIADEVLYGKINSICTTLEHTYYPSSTYYTSLTAQLLLITTTNKYLKIKIPINIAQESYYDSIKSLDCVSTQVIDVSGNYTFANINSSEYTYPVVLSGYSLPQLPATLDSFTFSDISLTSDLLPLSGEYIKQDYLVNGRSVFKSRNNYYLMYDLTYSWCMRGPSIDGTIINYHNSSNGSIYRNPPSFSWSKNYGPTYTNIQYLTSYNSSGLMAKNGNFMYPYDFTGMSVLNTYDNLPRRTITMVTPRHGIGAQHYQTIAQSDVYFYDGTTTYTRTVSALTQLTNDIVLVYLDSDVPASIKKYRIPKNINFLGEELLGFTQNLKCGLFRTNVQSGNNLGWSQTEAPDTSLTPGYIYAGDSSHPLFLIRNGEPLLVSHFYSILGGANYTALFDTISAAVANLDPASTGYRISAYP